MKKEKIDQPHTRALTGFSSETEPPLGLEVLRHLSILGLLNREEATQVEAIRPSVIFVFCAPLDRPAAEKESPEEELEGIRWLFAAQNMEFIFPLLSSRK